MLLYVLLTTRNQGTDRATFLLGPESVDNDVGILLRSCELPVLHNAISLLPLNPHVFIIHLGFI